MIDLIDGLTRLIESPSIRFLITCMGIAIIAWGVSKLLWSLREISITYREAEED